MKKSIIKTFAALTSVLTAGTVLAQVAPVIHAQDEGPSVDIPAMVEHEGEAIEGGVVRYALVSDTPFAGVLNNMLYTGNPDAVVIGFFNPGLYGYDENFAIDNSGFADIEMDQENRQVTISIPEDALWDDGEPITIDDVIFPYYVVGHPDYTGVRYGSDYQNVEGMEEYNAGDTDEISGLERVDDYTLTITYKQFPNSMLQAGGGIGSYIEPEHIFGEIPVAELEDSDAVRTNPVGFGPFKVDSMVAGESITFVANENYYRGRPNVDGLTLQVVNPTSIVAELKAGNYDLAELPADQYETYKDATNFSLAGIETNTYTYIGFKMGHWDAEEGVNVYDDSLTVSNLALRKAMAHAIDNDAVGQEFYQGLRRAAQSHITPNFVDYQTDEVEAYEYDPELAVQILEEAGFVDNDGDGFVEDPNGEPFTLNFASMSGGEIAEPLAQYYLQQWQSIGIDIQLLDGQLIEFNSFYERVEADDPEIHVYQGAWGTGGDPNPNGLYGPDAQFNYTRYVSDEHTEILDRIASDDAFDDEFRAEAFRDWQVYMMDNIPNIPTLWRFEITGVNQRVNNWDTQIGTDLDWTEIYLTAEEPIAE